jgi:hypothetical protein
MPNAVLWQWAKDEGHTIDEVAERLGYSRRYTELVLRGWERLSDGFIGRFFQMYPDDAIKLLPYFQESHD